MATVTFDGAADWLRDYAHKLTEAAKGNCLEAAGESMIGVYKDRIFDEGLDSNGTPIGRYSTKPITVTKKQFEDIGPFKPQGKNGAKKKKDGTAYKSMYLPQGYKQLRDLQGRPTANKNYNYSSSLMRSIQLYKDGDRHVIAIADPKESIKRRANEKRDGKVVFAASENEVKVFEDAFITQLQIEADKLT